MTNKTTNTKTLKLDEKTALKLYKTGSHELKTILEESFGVDFFKPKKLIDKIKDFDDILELAGYESDEDFLESKGVSKASIKTQNIERLQLIEEVYAEGVWKRNWNGSQYHYYPYFRKSSGLWCLDCHYCDLVISFGSLAYFETSEKALDAGTKFIKIFTLVIENK